MFTDTNDGDASRGHGGDAGGGQGPTYFLDIEGQEKPWHEATVTLAQIRTLAGWSADQEVVEVDLDTDEEVTLTEDTVVHLKPGHGFAKKIKFKRGRR